MLEATIVLQLAVGEWVEALMIATLLMANVALGVVHESRAEATLAAALGGRTLALQGVLLTQLTALHESAMFDVLCVDKTGTLTENSLSVSGVWAAGDADVLALAAAASSPAGRDPIDTAIRAATTANRLTAIAGLETIAFPALLPVVAIVIVLATPLTYLWIERPAMRQGKLLANWFADRRIKRTGVGIGNG